VRKLILGVFILVFGVATAHADPLTATFNLNSAGSGANLAGVYTSPYTGTINGGPTIAVICDDFADESYVPENWTAYVTPLSSLTSGSPDTYLKWLNTSGSSLTVGSYTLNQAAAYTVAAVLAVDILHSPTGSPAQEDYSYALWELFDYSDASSQLLAHGDTIDAKNAFADLTGAVTYVETSSLGPGNYSNVTIYSYDPGATCVGATCPTTAPQEFITVSTPEPSSLVLLALGLLSLVGLALTRRRLVGSVNLTQA
jgi:hypothetical protein